VLLCAEAGKRAAVAGVKEVEPLGAFRVWVVIVACLMVMYGVIDRLCSNQ
jgi:hypothetical protein